MSWTKCLGQCNFLPPDPPLSKDDAVFQASKKYANGWILNHVKLFGDDVVESLRNLQDVKLQNKASS